MKVTAGEATIRLLARYGVDTIFGIPGVHTLDFCRGLGEGGAIRHVQARNEMGAGFMADGYARASGKVAACFIITGPGMTNIISQIASAQFNGAPLVALSGRAPQSRWGAGSLQEFDHLPVVTPLVKRAATVFPRAETFPWYVLK